MIKVLVDLARGTVLDQEAAEDSETSHPHHLAVLRNLHISQLFPMTPSFMWACSPFPPIVDSPSVEFIIPRHPSISRTLPLSETPMSPDPPRRRQIPSTGTRVHGDLLADDEAIGHELADGLTGVGVGDFAGLVRVEPDLTLAAADHGGRETLLGAKVDPVERMGSAGVDAR